MNSIGQVFNVANEEIVLGDWLCDTNDIGFLEGIPTNEGTRYLPGDSHDWRRIHVGGGKSGDEIGGSGATGRYTYADFTSGTSVAISSMGCGLLMSHQNMAQGWIGGERIIEGHDRATRVAIE